MKCNLFMQKLDITDPLAIVQRIHFNMQILMIRNANGVFASSSFVSCLLSLSLVGDMKCLSSSSLVQLHCNVNTERRIHSVYD